MDAPLKGIRVLDLSRVLAGPLSTMVLADLGADVIKVEEPGVGDGTRGWGVEIGKGDTSYFYAFNRNKRSITLDLGLAADREVLTALVRDADVVVENFKAGTMERFGLGFDALKVLRPSLVYCAISGYDRAGDESARPGYDLVLQGETGLMSINGHPDDGPLKFGLPVVDILTGMAAAQAILAAVLAAKSRGEGRRIDVALFDVGLTSTAYFALDALIGGSESPRYGNFHPSIFPYGVFTARDGAFILGAGTERHYQALCRNVVERPDLADDPRFGTNLQRLLHRSELLAELEREFARHDRSTLLAGLARAGIPCGEVGGLYAALTGARATSAGLVTAVKHPTAGDVPLLRPAWRLDGDRPEAIRPPMLGEHNEEIKSRVGSSGAWK